MLLECIEKFILLLCTLGVCVGWAYVRRVDEQSRSHLRRLPHVIRLFRPSYGALRCGDEPLEINEDILVRVSSPSPEYNDRLSSDPSSYFFGPVVVNFIFCVFLCILRHKFCHEHQNVAHIRTRCEFGHTRAELKPPLNNRAQNWAKTLGANWLLDIFL